MRIIPLSVALFASQVLCVNNANAVLNGISLIGNYTIQLNADVLKFTNVSSGIPYGLQVQEDAVNLHKQIIAATALTNSSDNFGEPGSAQIAVAVINLVGTVQNTLQNVTSKARSFDFLRPIVLASLYQLKQDTDQFGTAVQNHLDPIEGVFAPLVVSQFDNSFNSAITAYGGKSESPAMRYEKDLY